MVGPNRFLRRFQGDAAKAGKDLRGTPTYAAAPDTGQLALWFALANSIAADVTFTVTSANYRADDPWTHTVQPGGSVFRLLRRHRVPERLVRLHGHREHRRHVVARFTGRLENGSAGVSG